MSIGEGGKTADHRTAKMQTLQNNTQPTYNIHLLCNEILILKNESFELMINQFTHLRQKNLHKRTPLTAYLKTEAITCK